MFAILISDLEEAKSYSVTLDDHPLLHEYANMFPDEIPGMPSQRDIDFRIDLYRLENEAIECIYERKPLKLPIQDTNSNPNLCMRIK